MWPSHLDSSSSKQREQNSVHDFPSSVHPLFRLPPPGHSFIVPLISVLLSIGWIVKQQAKHDTSKSEAYFNAEPRLTPLKSISHASRSSPRLPIAAGHVETQASMFVLASSSQITAVSTGLRLFTRARCIQCSWWDSPALQKLMISQVLGLRLVQSLKKVKSATDRSEVEAPDSRRLL
ncbi:hypothetical protein ACO22_04305 [Paracoccidioides brasiliensis]|uniref:Uncharacterized protein n=1 Tax=Paracoccidioides brasiliensis TaxID=121759 RepID=A0A1D2JDQ3_PARBR|nr:hypothetical protein ACO22_04305 [Paracoccidioides brasiliensis]